MPSILRLRCVIVARMKRAARSERLVRITENGNGARVFCSGEGFQREVDDAVRQALYASVSRCNRPWSRTDITASGMWKVPRRRRRPLPDKRASKWRGLGSRGVPRISRRA